MQSELTLQPTKKNKTTTHALKPSWLACYFELTTKKQHDNPSLTVDELCMHSSLLGSHAILSLTKKRQDDHSLTVDELCMHSSLLGSHAILSLQQKSDKTITA